MSRDDAAILDMINACELVISFRSGFDEDAFLNDEKTQSAILHQLLVLGEAAKRVSADFAAGHPELPWRAMAGMQDKLIHHDDAVDLDEVWRTTERDIPPLVSLLRSLGE